MAASANRYSPKFDEARDLAGAIVESIREPLVVVDEELRVVTANRSFCHKFKVGLREVQGQPFHALDGGRWDPDTQLFTEREPHSKAWILKKSAALPGCRPQKDSIMFNLMNPFAYMGGSNEGGDRLSNLDEFGTNPGFLRALTYIPEDLPIGAPLVIVLHGCKQTAEDYDCGSGWSDLADRHGFALLFPEQRHSNNWSLGFNWFEPRNSRRGSGEPLSIRQMVEQVVGDHDIDRRRIFITGLSAGGAMTSVMLATYPEVFAGGAIIAGLPYGCASTVPAAFRRMRGCGGPTGRQLAARLRNASRHEGPWPTISIWHGSRDHTVDRSNVEAIIHQWRTLLKLGRMPSRTHLVDGYPRRVWHDSKDHELMEAYSITGMGHGTPLKTGGRNGCGSSGDYMLDVNISSTRHIAAFWGLRSSKAAT